MLSPLRANPGMAPVSRGASTPAPVGGWNARDSLADMSPDDAITLENWFPDTDSVRVRKGYSQHVSGLTGAVETLMPYSAPGGTVKLFAAANGGIHDVTNTTATAAAASVTSLTSIRFQHAMFTNSAGAFLYAVNGADAPVYYDGSSWTAPTITGSSLTASNLVHVNVYKRRLFFVEKNTLNFWYFPVETISGAIARFRIGGLCALGGYLQAMGTWTLDAGDGIDDYAVFVTSEGEAVIYRGTDPGDAAAWSLVGVFRIGRPIGRRCFLKVGPDLVIITQDGFYPLSSAIGSARTNQRVAISDKIRGAVVSAAKASSDTFGWQPILYPRGNMVLFNVPTNTGAFEQYVANATTGAWCKFTGMNASSWAVHDDALYFGGSGAVYKADDTKADNGADIRETAKQAFNYFGQRGRQKRFTMARPIIASEGAVQPAIAANVDFRDQVPTSTPLYSGSDGSPWDTSPWDTSPWGGAQAVRVDWQSVDGVGFCAALNMVTQTNGLSLTWYATDWIYESGGLL